MATYRDRVISTTGGEIVGMSDARRQVGVYDTSDDQHIRSLVESARDYCERWSERTLQVRRTRARDYDGWPDSPVVLPWPPVMSLTHVRYYDADNVQQTLDAANYRTTTTSEGVMQVEWADAFTYPDYTARQDAVTFTFVTGYPSIDQSPAAARQAILMTLSTFDAREEPNWLQVAERRAMQVLSTVSHPSYQ